MILAPIPLLYPGQILTQEAVLQNPVETFFNLYVRSFSSSYVKSFLWFMWGIMQRLVAYTMFVVTQS